MPDKGLPGDFPNLQRADIGAVPKNGGPVTYLEYFFQPVAYIDDCYPGFLKLPDDFKQGCGLACCQGSRWLVQGDDLGVVEERLGDCQHLHFPRSQAAGHVLGPEAAFQPVKDLIHGLVKGAVVNHDATAGFITQGDILPHCQVAHHVHFLVDFYDMAFPDGLVGVLKGYLVPSQPYFTFIFLIDAVKDIQQRGFAGSVFP